MHLSMQVATSVRRQLSSVFLRRFARGLKRAGVLALRRADLSLTATERAIVGVHWVDAREMTRLNSQHMGERRVTDVLSFPAPLAPAFGPEEETAVAAVLSESQDFLGDIVLCWPELWRQAATARGVDPQLKHHQTAILLAIHGLAHLLGHDHRSASEGRAMHLLEAAALRRVGVPDRERPYTRQLRT